MNSAGPHSPSPGHAQAVLLDALQSDVEAHLLANWTTCFPELGARGQVRRVLARSHGFSVVMVFDAESAAGTTRVFAKARRGSRSGEFGSDDPDSPAGRLVRSEYDALSAANAFFSPRGHELGVVRPVAFLPHRNTIVIEAARGEDLGVVLRRRDAATGTHMGRCGRWLGLFHRDLHGREHHPWPAAAFRERLLKRCRALANAPVAETLFEGTVGRLERAAERVDGVPVLQTMLHGDFKARHIWAGPDRIEVLDFGNVHHGPCYDDVAAFLVELEVGSLGRLTGDDPRFDEYATAFLNAYGDGLDRRVLSLYQADWLLKKWTRRRRKLSAGGGVLARVANRVKPIGEAVGRFHVDPWFASHLARHAEAAAR
jgi:hypothetical protein